MLRSPITKGPFRPWHTRILVCCLLVGCIGGTQAQHWSDGNMPGYDWDQAFLDFENTWSDSIPERGKGFKPFMRWRHFAEARFAFDGAPPFTPAAIWQATKWERQGRQARTTPETAIWTPAVPEGLPLVGGAGRVNRVVVDPQDTSRWMACAPSGGIWVTEDSGASWNVMGTHDWAGMGVSDVALHPDNPDRVLAATGDADFGSAYAVGLMETMDGGVTWETTGLSFALEEGITCSRVHRKEGDPTQILVATSDGVWMSEDDGGSFVRTLEGLCSDLLPHPGDSALWYAALRPGALMRSTDGGRHWESIPEMPSPFLISRYTLATSASNPARIAAIAAKSGTQGLEAVYVSNDSGATFQAIPDVPNLLGWTVDGVDFGGQGFYDLALAVDPMDADHMLAGGVNLWESYDGGTAWTCIGHWFAGADADYIHADHHAVTFLPGTSDWISAHDGGVGRSSSGVFSDLSSGLEVGQVYRVGWSDSRPDRLLSGWQDNGVNFLKNGVHAQVLGADGFHCLIDPMDPQTMIAAEYYGKAYRSTDGGWSWAPWIQSSGDGVDEQGDWNTPMMFAPNYPGRILVAKHRVYWTDDGGVQWNQSAALPGAEIELMVPAPSEDSTVLVARGANAFITHDLDSWSPLADLPGLPVLDGAFDDTDADRFWLSFGGYVGDQRVWRTEDGGTTWESAGEGLPALPVNTLVRHAESGDLYAGTDAGVYVLVQGSSAWTPYKAGLPEVLCSDLGIRSSTGELLLATYGRGLWKAPLHTPPNRDAAVVGITGMEASPCSGPMDVAARIRNAGLDTLVSITLVWNNLDTATYGMVLPPNSEIPLAWHGAQRGSVPAGEHLVVRILDVVGLDGGLDSGSMVDGPDAVAENDVLGSRWEHRTGTGAVVMTTLADCAPMESAWALVDSTDGIWSRRQHFPIESVIRDTLCLAHGCYDILLHDASNNGFAGPQCGMEGEMLLMNMVGDTIWDLHLDPAGIGFDSGLAGPVCLPMPGWEGCTDPNACNFDPSAELDDGSCAGPCAHGAVCPTDLDGDGFHGASDILALLSEFGCSEGCTLDITGDGSVSALDILALLALYGEACGE